MHHLPNPQGKWGYLLALGGGILAPYSLAPYGIWPLGILSLLLFLISLQQASPKRAALTGWFYGLGLYGAGVSWVYVSIHQYGHASPPLAALLTLVFVAGLSLLFSCTFAYAYVRLLRDRFGGLALGFPALWVLFEWLRSWLFTGFPWLYLGYAHTDTLLGHWSPILGVYGVSIMVAASASLLYLLIGQLGSGKLKPRSGYYATLLILPWLAGIALSPVNWVKETGDELKVTLLQPNITQDVKWQPEQRNKTLSLLYNQTRQHLDSDLIVWPENAVPLFHHQARSYLSQIDRLARASNTAVITGIPYWQPAQPDAAGAASNDTMHNSITALGAGTGLYHKQKLVPFGEYVPLQQWLRGLIQFFNLPMSDFRPGPAGQAPLTVLMGEQTLRIAPYICYEIVYPDFVRVLAQHSDILLTISDDSWFGSSAGPYQHLQMARMRAMENGRYLVRGTNTGITAIVDHHGKLVSQAQQFSLQSLTGKVKITAGQTPFSRWGSWPVLLGCGLLLIIIVLRRKSVQD